MTARFACRLHVLVLQGDVSMHVPVIARHRSCTHHCVDWQLRKRCSLNLFCILQSNLKSLILPQPWPTRRSCNVPAALHAQILTGEGPLGQLQLELGLPEWGVDLLVLGIVGYSFVGGLRPGSPTFSEANQRDVRKRGAGA